MGQTLKEQITAENKSRKGLIAGYYEKEAYNKLVTECAFNKYSYPDSKWAEQRTNETNELLLKILLKDTIGKDDISEIKSSITDALGMVQMLLDEKAKLIQTVSGVLPMADFIVNHAEYVKEEEEEK